MNDASSRSHAIVTIKFTQVRVLYLAECMYRCVDRRAKL